MRVGVCVCVFITSAGQKLLTACRDFREPEMKDLFEICMTRYASVSLCVCVRRRRSKSRRICARVRVVGRSDGTRRQTRRQIKVPPVFVQLYSFT